MEYRSYIILFSALLAPITAVTAIIGVWIAYRQHKLKLYDRRIEIYRGLYQHLSVIQNKGEVSIEDLFNLARSTAEKKFLFNKDIGLYIDEFSEKSRHLRGITMRKEQSMQDSQKELDLNVKKMELLEWFALQPQEIENKFKKYLSVTK